ncbi:HNH nuclease [Microbacterium sp. HM58-2]|nr:HNH nuclease [Microbacterium sp. HM58-2]
MTTPAHNANGARRRALVKRVKAEENDCALCDQHVDKTLLYIAGEHGKRCPTSTFEQVVASDETAPATRYTLRADWDAGRELNVITGLYIPAGDWTFSELLINAGFMSPGAVAYGFGPPPPALQGVLYVDITGPDAVFYAPNNGGI